MRPRPRRHRWLTVSVFFIVYSVFQAVFSGTTARGVTDDDVTLPDVTSTSTEKPIFMTAKEIVGEAMKGFGEETEEGAKQNDASYVESDEGETIREEEAKECAVPTVRPPRTCAPPAIEQFPRPHMRPSVRKHGGLIIHVLVCIFTFIGLTIVCNHYFVPSIERICEELHLAPNVAGATFMAAGSSAPELATAVIGVFWAQDDIGVTGVVSSAVFNMSFVSVCALCAGAVSHLNWWPVYRDCFFYAISILVLLCIIVNGYVCWPEALFMLFMYGVYCVALRFNSTLERWVLTILPFKGSRVQQEAVIYCAGAQPPAAPPADGQYTQVEGQTKETSIQESAHNPNVTYDNADPNAIRDPHQTRDGGGDSRNNQAPVQPAYYKEKEYNPETAVNPLVKPIGAHPLQLAWWFISYPVHWSCRHTMPDCRGRWYPATFLISMLWISFYSYFMVWMITIIGFTLGIPDTVMGLTFVASGVSVPDALSSFAVIKKGYGDMAVSNAVGSNVFDILVCLGLPWFIQTAIVHPGTHVNVISKGVIYTTLSLFSTVIFLVVATHANGWKLDRKYGAVLMVWYLLFITFASLYELNVFGDFHPPDCDSGRKVSQMGNLEQRSCGDSAYCLPLKTSTILIGIISLVAGAMEARCQGSVMRRQCALQEHADTFRQIHLALFQTVNLLLLAAVGFEKICLLELYILYTLSYVVMGVAVAIIDFVLTFETLGVAKSLVVFAADVAFFFVLSRCLPLVDDYRLELEEHKKYDLES